MKEYWSIFANDMRPHALWHAVTWAVDEFEQLRHRKHKVEDLRYHEDQHCFAELAYNSNNSKGHA